MILDVRYKMLLLVLVSILPFFVKDLLFGSILFAVVCIISFSMGQGKATLKYAAAYIGVVALQFLAPHFPWVLRSIFLMLALCMRMFLPVLLYARTFAATTAVSEIINGMYAMRMSRALTISLAVALRFFPSVKEELHAIRDAMKLRGLIFSARNLLARPALVFEWVMVPMMMRASTIADELSAASITRGIDNPGARTSFTPLRITARDTVIVIVFGLMICGVVAAKMLCEVWA
ncbi:MAG: energy-coupling factor transporter transmembrane component T [Oscillospiraceae bacterium]